MTFDFWNTLAVEVRGSLADRRAEAWVGLLEGAGFAAERERLDAVFEKAWEAYVVAWKANEQFLATHAAEHALAALGLDVPDDLRPALVEAFAGAGGDVELQLADHVADTLARLKGAGVRLGIVCDVGFTPSPVLRRHLDGHGVLELFDSWSFSDEVGVYKPAPAIFEHALDGLGGVAPGDAAHVGDLRRTDVAGAKGVGMTAVRYTGVFDDPTEGPEGDHVVADHARLPAVLGF